MRRLLVAVAAVVALLATAQPAHAEDKRPCVSKAEYYGARDFNIPLMPGVDAMSKVPYVAHPVGRLVLETKWDVRNLGVTVSRTLSGMVMGMNPLVRIKMYPVCGFPLSELQIYVAYHKDTNLVFWTMLWRAP